MDDDTTVIVIDLVPNGEPVVPPSGCCAVLLSQTASFVPFLGESWDPPDGDYARLQAQGDYGRSPAGTAVANATGRAVTSRYATGRAGRGLAGAGAEEGTPGLPIARCNGRLQHTTVDRNQQEHVGANANTPGSTA